MSPVRDDVNFEGEEEPMTQDEIIEVPEAY